MRSFAVGMACILAGMGTLDLMGRIFHKLVGHQLMSNEVESLVPYILDGAFIAAFGVIGIFILLCLLWIVLEGGFQIHNLGARILGTKELIK